MLLSSPRHTPEDLRIWERLERYDRVLSKSPELAKLEERALKSTEAFTAAGHCYVGVSWGKDSVVVAHLALRTGPDLPLVWVRVEPICNPDCAAVRDAFLVYHPATVYREIEVWCPKDANGWHATGTLEEGFRTAAAEFGDRHVSGVRGEESAQRRLRMQRWGVSTPRTCAPIGHWRAEHVFAYLSKYDLPVHPAYAMSFGGVLDRSRLRVASLGGEHGTGHGRRDWEQRYYRDAMGRLR